MSKEERKHATTSSAIQSEPTVNKTLHRIDAELVTELEDEMKVWAYLMTQYNLKPGLRKFDAKGTAAALDELTQLHIWKAMDLSKLMRENQMNVLSLLLFLKEK